MMDKTINQFPIHGDTTSFSGIFPVLALSLLPIENVNGGIFSRITMTGMTSKWYLRLSHFEAIFVGLVVLQIFVMRYFLILPLDLSKLIDDGTLLATSVSRKKRRVGVDSKANAELRLSESMFSILRRLDENDCFVRTLCELERDSSDDVANFGKLPNLLSTLKRLGKRRMKFDMPQNNMTISERKVIDEFMDAVLLGSGYSTELDSNVCTNIPGNQNICASHYSLCDVDRIELLGYVKNIVPFLS